MGIVGILFIVFVCGAAVGVLIMCFVRGAATLEMSSQLYLKDKLIEEMTGDWLTISVHSKEENAQGIARRWVGDDGKLARISNDEF